MTVGMNIVCITVALASMAVLLVQGDVSLRFSQYKGVLFQVLFEHFSDRWSWTEQLLVL